MSRAWQGLPKLRWLLRGWIVGRLPRRQGTEKLDVKVTVQAAEGERPIWETTGFVCGLRLSQVQSFLCGWPSLRSSIHRKCKRRVVFLAEKDELLSGKC